MTTVPTGAMTLTIAAGTGSSRTVTAVSVPLLMIATASGQMAGQITDVTSTTLGNSAAGWTPGQLSTAATPYVLRMKSGAAAGRTFLISTVTANTATTVTIDSADAASDLTALSITVGDTYEIIAADTLAILFPAGSGVQGGTSAAAADNILIHKNGVWRTYYYNTTLDRWTQVSLGNPEASNEPVRPDTALLYSRLANSSLSVTVLGTVPSVDRKVPVANSGATFLATGWPTGISLLASGIHFLPGWVASSTASSADKVLLLSGGVYKTYYFDGTNWRQVALGNPIKNGELISATAGVLFDRRGTASGTSVLSQSMPYSL